MRMTRKQARNLEKRLTTPNDAFPIHCEGTITITDAESNTTTTELLFSAEDILGYLSRGYTMPQVLKILNNKAAN